MPTRCCSPPERVARHGCAHDQQAHLVQRRAHAAIDIAVVKAADQQGQGDVVEDAAVEQQPVILEHHADRLPVAGYGAAAQLREVRAGHLHPAARRPLHEHDEAQQGALAGAGVSREEDQLVAADLETDLAQGIVAALVALADALEADHGRQSRLNRASMNSPATKGRRSSALLADTDKADRQLELLGNGENHAALCRAVELGQRNTRTPTACVNWSACARAFWPVVASSTSITSWGRIHRACAARARPSSAPP
jgi:hypothetical protein